MRRRALFLLLLPLAACSGPPAIDWPASPATPTPALLPTSELAPPPASPDPGPAQAARAANLRSDLGL